MDADVIQGCRKKLDEYMGLLSDIRRSTVLLCDSIRTRERRSLQILGVDDTPSVDVSAYEVLPVRCPICITEFKDPTVVLTTCGHGMHKSCAESFEENNDDGSGDSQVFDCPICRAPFRRRNVLQLVGLMSPVCQAREWRSIQLTAPWAFPDASDPKIQNLSEADTAIDLEDTVRDSVLERLYIRLRALYRDSSELSRVIDGALAVYEEAITVHSEAISDAREREERMAKREKELYLKLEARIRRVEAREARALSDSYRNEAFFAQCTKAVKKEEAHHLTILESMVRRQNRLDRSSEELKYKQERVETAFKDLEIRRKHIDDVENRSKQKQLNCDRRLVASQKPLVGLRNDNTKVLGDTNDEIRVTAIIEDSGVDEGYTDSSSDGFRD